MTSTADFGFKIKLSIFFVWNKNYQNMEIL